MYSPANDIKMVRVAARIGLRTSQSNTRSDKRLVGLHCTSLIEKSFRYLAKIGRLGEFWSGVLRHYGKDVPKLDDNKMRYIIRARRRGESTSDIARNLSVSRRRVEQVYAYYQKNGKLPSLSKAG